MSCAKGAQVNNGVVVDASVVLKLVLSEPDSDTVQALWTAWVTTETQIYAPCHLRFEVTSVLRNRVHRGLLTEEEGEAAHRLFLTYNVILVHPEGLAEAAWATASKLGRPTAYDSYYLALAETMECEFWTADLRLIRATGRSPRIKSITTVIP
jgi:predicted nucleic acid-binding protein